MVLVIKDNNGEWQETLQFARYGKSLDGGNQARFSQSTTAETPFTQKLLLGDFRYLVVGEKATQALKGTHIPPKKLTNTPKAPRISKIYESIKKLLLVSTVLTTMDYIQGWRKRRESKRAKAV